MTQCDVPVMTVWCPLSVLGPVRHCSVWLHVLGLSLPHVPKIIWAFGLCPQMHIKTNSCCSLELTGVKLTNSCSRSRVHWNWREYFQQPTLYALSVVNREMDREKESHITFQRMQLGEGWTSSLCRLVSEPEITLEWRWSAWGHGLHGLRLVTAASRWAKKLHISNTLWKKMCKTE